MRRTLAIALLVVLVAVACTPADDATDTTLDPFTAEVSSLPVLMTYGEAFDICLEDVYRLGGLTQQNPTAEDGEKAATWCGRDDASDAFQRGARIVFKDSEWGVIMPDDEFYPFGS